jgi:hypothetical protein
MADTTIFILGFFITLIWGSTVGLLLWAAIEDGRRNRMLNRRESGQDVSNSSDSQNVQ